jgi:subtilisin family serine protease
VIASSGNGCNPAFTTWPASNPYVLSVGALDRNGKEDEVSNFGATLLARGVDVRVAYLPPNEYHTSSGTSYAAPYIAGMACLLLAQSDTYPGLRSAEVRPGGLKSLLLDRFVVKQQGRTQPERLRRRSDGESPEDEGENEEVDAAKGGGEDASGDKTEDADTQKPIDAPDPDNTKEVKVEDESINAEAGSD